jgi:RNA polymerase sigma-70 factor (ECF subfamily)
MRYMSNPADAEDATQETFIKAYRGLRHFRCECALYTWLYRIACNCAGNLLRARRRDFLNNTIDLADFRDAARHPTRLRELATPEELALTADIRGTVNIALDELSEEHRAVITMREIDGLSYEEIASVMCIPVGTVRSRIFRARDFIDHKLRGVHDAGLGRHPPQRSHNTDLNNPLSQNAV